MNIWRRVRISIFELETTVPKKKRSTENESEMESGFKTIRALGESIRGKNRRKEFIENVLTYDSSNTIDEGRKEVDSDIQNEFEKIHSEIFREIYIIFFRGLKKIRPLQISWENTTPLYLKRIKKYVRPTFDSWILWNESGACCLADEFD